MLWAGKEGAGGKGRTLGETRGLSQTLETYVQIWNSPWGTHQGLEKRRGREGAKAASILPKDPLAPSPGRATSCGERSRLPKPVSKTPQTFPGPLLPQRGAGSINLLTLEMETEAERGKAADSRLHCRLLAELGFHSRISLPCRCSRGYLKPPRLGKAYPGLGGSRKKGGAFAGSLL